MQPKDYFKKTFIGVFIFILVFKTMGLIMTRFADFNLKFVLKTVAVSLITALILGGINYYAKVGFNKGKPKDN